MSVAWPANAAAAIIFNEQFNTNSSSANFAANYPNYTISGPSASVVSQALNLSSTSLTTAATFSGHLLIEVDLNAVSINSPGNTQIGLTLGSGTSVNNVLFHPGLSTGAFRVDGFSSQVISNQDMGFTPVAGTIYHLTVESSGTGDFTATVTNTTNLAETYSNSWQNTALAASPYTIGVYYGGGTGAFDNFTVSAIPEPRTYALLAPGAFALVLFRRRWLTLSV